MEYIDIGFGNILFMMMAKVQNYTLLSNTLLTKAKIQSYKFQNEDLNC